MSRDGAFEAGIQQNLNIKSVSMHEYMMGPSGFDQSVLTLQSQYLTPELLFIILLTRRME